VNTRTIQLVTITLASFAALAAEAAAPPTASELLDKYKQALDATQSMIEFYEEACEASFAMPNGVSASNERLFERGQHRIDGKRLYCQKYIWGDVSPEEKTRPESKPRYSLWVEAEKQVYHHTAVSNVPGTVYSSFPAQRERGVESVSTYSGIFGFLGGDERLDAVLRGARRISVRSRTESVRGAACYVIDADTKHGQYGVWLDPSHGYNAAKVTRRAVAGQLEGEYVIPAGALAGGSVEIGRFEQIDGVWVPMEADHQMEYADRQMFRNDRDHYKRTKVTLNPDHEKLGSFDDPLLKNPANDPELKLNGTAVESTTGRVHVRGTLRDGKVVDAGGNVLFVAGQGKPEATKTTAPGKK
jgi:hypothetical protein